MSTISISNVQYSGFTGMVVTKKSRTTSSVTSSHDFRVIIGITSLLFAIIVVGIMVPLGISYYDGTTARSTSECRGMILGFEQKGFYASHNQFKSAISYC